MIARFSLATPFLMVVPEDTEYQIREYEDSGYRVRLLPPVRSDVPVKGDIPEKFEVDGRPAFAANAFRIDFVKDSFDRGAKASDPPNDIIARAVTSLIRRLRYVTKAWQVSPIDFPEATWRLEYVNDDGTQLEQKAGQLRARAARGFHVSFVGVTPETWNHIHSLPVDWQPPPWHDLLLDANGALPKVGTAVVLAATALEVFISDTLDELAGRSDVSQAVWAWINHRGDWQKDPSTEEQFDFLLGYFVGHSLKEDASLWESFKNLRTARNTFVHEGAAKLGGQDVTSQRAAQLIARANEIVRWVRQWMPPDLRWPEFELTSQVMMEMTLLENPAPRSKGAQNESESP